MTTMEGRTNAGLISEVELDQVTGGASNQADALGAFALELFGVRTGQVNYQYARARLAPACIAGTKKPAGHGAGGFLLSRGALRVCSAIAFTMIVDG
jgi:hypothetical protein